jgi:hypothetical protein
MPKQPTPTTPRAPRAAASPQTPAAAPAASAAPPAPSALALAPAVDNEALLAFQATGIDLEQDDSCSELAPSDFRTAVKLFNLKGKTAADGTKVMQDLFYDSVDNTVQETVEFAILGLHKSNLYSIYDAGEGRTNRLCSSYDQVTGVWAEDGHTRKCEGCPDRNSMKQADGKVRSNCSQLFDLFCLELQNTRVFMLRGKRTSLPPIKNYLHQHHFSKGGVKNGKRLDLPLYAYRVKAWLEMDQSGNYANLMLEKGALFSPNDLKVLHESAQAIRETLAERLAEAEQQTAAVETDGGTDGSFNYGANSGEAPQQFVNT